MTKIIFTKTILAATNYQIMENPKISIIANFYKSEKFIPKLVKSVLAQTFTDWEFIAVNDCSPGDDLKLLRKYEAMPEMRSRMRIVDNKTNLGISFAKAEGIKVAKGDFLTFIDGDDWFEPQALEKMYQAAVSNNLDIVVANCYRAFRFGYKKLLSSRLIEFDKIYDKSNYKDVLMGFFGINKHSSVAYWGKLFRRDIPEKSSFCPMTITLYEDFFFNFEAQLVSERMMFIDFPVYNWRWGGSVPARPINRRCRFRHSTPSKTSTISTIDV